MFGQEVEVGSVNGFSLGDTLGSSISGGLGTIGISGKAVKIETFHRGMGVAHLIAATLEMIWSVAAVGRSIDGDTDDVEKAMPALQAISGIARDLTGNCTRPPDDAGQDLVLFVLNLIVNIIRAVIDNCDYPTVIKEPKQRDRLNLAGLVVEWGYLLAAQGILILKNAGTDWTHEATIELKADASLSFEGTLGKSLFTLETYNAITVAAAAPTDAQKKQAVSDSSISVKNQEPKLGWGLLNGIPNAISEISDLINGYVNDYHSAFNAEAELKEL